MRWVVLAQDNRQALTAYDSGFPLGRMGVLRVAHGKGVAKNPEKVGGGVAKNPEKVEYRGSVVSVANLLAGCAGG